MNKIIQGDCLEKLKDLEENSVDSIVTDPPYELGFMGKSWDSTGIANNVELWKECLRVLKPGGHLLSFGGTRTYHRMATAIEDAGFEVRDMIEWIYGSGFPKSLNIGKAVDKIQRGNKTVKLINALLEKGKTLKELGEMTGIPSLESSYRDWTTGGHKPEERSWDRMLKGLGFSEADGLNIIEKRTVSLGGGNTYTFREGEKRDWEMKITKGNSEWEGWGTAIKPAHEPICMARKPLSEKTVAENVLKYGTGGINIDESRVGTSDKLQVLHNETGEKDLMGNMKGKDATGRKIYFVDSGLGRFPANLIHDNSEEVRECFPESKGGAFPKNHGSSGFVSSEEKESRLEMNDSGNASRFFKSIIYQAKASKGERNRGMDDIELKEWKQENSPNPNREERPFLPVKNNHPTVKPITLMEYLIKMITPKGGIVLDPFAGSGSTLVAAKQNGFNYIGIEREEEYIKIIEARLK